MLKSITNINNFKRSFFNKLLDLRLANPVFNQFLLNVMTENTGYVVGGFLRDISIGKKSRDIDIILDIPQEKLIESLSQSGLNFNINRMSGIKIILNDFEADIWTVKNNWAFKNKVVKKNDDYILERIADGCFYNYDSLVINIHKGSVSVKNYNDFVSSGRLDILRKVDTYKKRNPTLEANILRALYIKKIYDIGFSDNCASYLAKTILKLNSLYDDSSIRINTVKEKYIKYSHILTYKDIYEGISELCYDYGANNININKNQTSLDL